MLGFEVSGDPGGWKSEVQGRPRLVRGSPVGESPGAESTPSMAVVAASTSLPEYREQACLQVMDRPGHPHGVPVPNFFPAAHPQHEPFIPGEQTRPC